MKTPRLRAGIAGLLVIAGATGRGSAATRTITFETREVTEAAVALSPAGTTLVFTMLGHLFEMPVAAKGEARQLTFGPYYDGDSVFSPAKAVGAADLGVLAPGKLADLVLPDANPLDNIKNTQAIWRTVKGGWIFEPPATRLTSSGEP